MKIFLLCLLLVSLNVFGSEALTTNSMDEVIAKVDEKAKTYGRDNVLLVLDIDNTILTMLNDLGSDQWYSWQEKIMKDPNCAPLCISTDLNKLLEAQAMLYSVGKMKPTEFDLTLKIKKLQALGQKIILLTSRSHELRSVTEVALSKNDMSFATSSLRSSSDKSTTYLPYDLKNLAQSGLTEADVQAASLGAARPVSFQNGVYMTSGQNKGIMLKVLLKLYKKNYKAVVFADDHQRHVDRMQAILGNLIDLTTYRYGGVDADVANFNAQDKTAVTEKWNKFQATLKEIGF